jgi:D-alanyl-D-alanine carboxypeptidase
MSAPNPEHTWKQTAIQLALVILVAFAGVSLATNAAFPDTTKKSLSENDTFWASIQTKTVKSPTSQQTQAPQTANKDLLAEADVSVDAAGYLVADLQTGEILAGKKAQTARPIASLTKLMTAVVARETVGDNTTIDITPSAAATYGSAGGLSAGESYTLSTLYYPLLLSSSNDAAAAIAEHTNRQRFLSLMNRKALAIGMRRAHFVDPSGLSAGNVASPQGVLALSQYIYKQHPFIFSITESAQRTAPNRLEADSAVFVNNHPLHSLPEFAGGKNGYTDEAQHTLLSVFRITKQQDERPVTIIVLGSDEQVTDTRKLLRWTQQI